MSNVIALVIELTNGQGQRDVSVKTLSTLGDFPVAPAPTSQILTRPWERAGCEDFSINRT